MRERYLFTIAYLEAQGLQHYEVSSFARPGAESRHNSGYWAHRNYLGFGPSAHSFWKATRSRARRWANVRHLGRYEGLLAAHHLPTEREEALGADDLADEYVLLALRRIQEGLDLGVLARDYGVDLADERAAALTALERGGLIHPVTDRVRLTSEGAAVADAVALKLVG
jgi:oxygen-independent coproporphyrinogen-3 oxidase